MKTSIALISVLLMVSISGSTSAGYINQAEWKGEIKYEDGIQVVKNPKTPVWNKNICEISEEITIGEEEGNEEYMFQRVGAIAVDGDERIYVSDRKAVCIKVYNEKGVFLRTIGKRGQGPGEFEGITRIQILANNELVVFDSRIRRLTFFSQDGGFIKSMSIIEIPAIDLRLNSNRGFVVNTVQLDPVSAEAVTSIGIYDPDFSLLKTIVTSEPKDVQTPFLPFYVWTILKNDTILYGFNKHYELNILNSEGVLIKKIKNDFTPVEVSSEERKESLKRLQQPLNKEVPRFHPAFRRVTSDEEGRLFVQTWEKPKNGVGYIYNIHDKDGRFIAKLVLKFPPQSWKNNKLYTVEEDEDGYQYIKRYKVSWNY